MAESLWSRATCWIDREWSMRLADVFAVALAVALPWSTSAALVFSVLWMIVFIPASDPVHVRRVLATAAGGLPVLFAVLFLLGTLWATGVPMAERFEMVRATYKFLLIPLLILHFMRSERGHWVMLGFMASCVVLLAASYVTLFDPRLIAAKGGKGVPVRDYIAQSNEFIVCLFLLAVLALDAWRRSRRGVAVALMALCGAFLLNLFAIATSRTALIVLPFLVLVFAMRHFSRSRVIAVVVVAVGLTAVIGTLSPNVRSSVTSLLSEVRDFTPDAISTRAGARIEFWTKSIGFIGAAPLIGHGTGSVREQFRKASVGEDKLTMGAMVTSNPHNQTFATAIQLGLLGTAVMFAMWLSHFLLFWRGDGFAAWAGLVVVTQNVIGSLFNAHLFDFLQGWGYVLGVGVAAGVLMRRELPQVSAATRSE